MYVLQEIAAEIYLRLVISLVKYKGFNNLNSITDTELAELKNLANRADMVFFGIEVEE